MVCNRKSSLMAVNTTAQDLPIDGLITYATSNKTGCSIGFTNGSNAVALRQGLYLVNVSADLLGTAAGEATLQLLKNGTAIPGAKAVTTLAAGGVSNVSFSAVIDVGPSCQCVDNTTTLQAQLQNIAATVNNTVMTVAKLA